MAGLVWLASYPKSGNTWLRLLLANLLSGQDTPANINRIELNGRSLVRRDAIDAATQIDSDLLTRDEADRLRARLTEDFAAELDASDRDAFVKVHDAYRHRADGTAPFGVRPARAVVYMLRDPRDVAVSLAWHNRVTIAEAISEMADADHVLSRNRNRRSTQLTQRVSDWSGHVLSWTEQRDVPLLLVRYEDLLADPVRTFETAVRFLGIPATTDQIARAVRFSAFAELQGQEARNGFLERQSPDAPFFRSGRAGAWVEVLTPAQAASITRAHGAVMAAFGYV